MEKNMFEKRIKSVCFLAAVLLMLTFHTASVYATNIETLPGGSDNDVPAETPSYVETVPTETVPDIPQEVVTEAPIVTEAPLVTEAPVIPEEPVATEAPVVPEQPVEPIVEEPQPEETLSSAEDTTETEAEITDSSEETSGETEIFIESSPEETWPMGFSGAGDGTSTAEETTEQIEEQTKQKEGAGTIAKIFAGIVMVLLIGGTVAYGYLSAAAKEELHRRERRARAWSEYGDEDE